MILVVFGYRVWPVYTNSRNAACGCTIQCMKDMNFTWVSVPALLQHWCIVACVTRTNWISFPPFVPNDLSREKDKEQEIDIKEKDRWRCLLAAVTDAEECYVYFVRMRNIACRPTCRFLKSIEVDRATSSFSLVMDRLVSMVVTFPAPFWKEIVKQTLSLQLNRRVTLFFIPSHRLQNHPGCSGRSKLAARPECWGLRPWW